MATIVHQYDQFLISQRQDGYVSLTDMAKAQGKLVGHYLALESTNEFLHELAQDIAQPISSLVLIVQGKGKTQGTWAHPNVAIDFAYWCSVPFKLWAINTLLKVITGSAPQSDRLLIEKERTNRAVLLQNLKHQQRLELFHLRHPKKVVIEQSIGPDKTNYDKGLTAWADERLIFDPSAQIQVGTSENHKGSLAADYLQFCTTNNFTPLRFNRFSRELVSYLQKCKQWILRRKRLATGATIENLAIAR